MKKRLLWLLAILTLLCSGTAPSAAAADAKEPDYPCVESITPGTNGFTVRWDAYPDAVKYRLFVRDDNGKWARIGDTAGTSLNHLGLSDQTAYTYTVRALDGAGRYMSLYSVPGWTKTYLCAPKLLSAAPSGDAMRIRWQKAPGVDCYRLYKRVGGAWQGVAFVNGDEYLDKDVASGESCVYTVRGVNAAHTEFLSAYSASGIGGRYIAVPRVTNVESLDGVVRIRFSGANGAVRYRLFYKNGSGWKAIGDTAATTFEYRTDAVGVTRTYTVRALNAAGVYSSDFAREGFTHTHLATPRMTGVENAFGGQKITWEPVEGAERYRVYRLTGGKWVRFGDTTSTVLLAAGLDHDTAYTYTVRCVAADESAFVSGFDRAGMTARYYEAPDQVRFKNLASGVQLSWDAPGASCRYRVFVREDGAWKRVGDVDGAACVVPDAQVGESRTYTVRMIDNSGRYLSGYAFPGFEHTYYMPPVFGAVIPDGDAITLCWEPCTDAAGYRVYRRLFGGAWERAADVTDTCWTDEAVPADVPCQYALCSLDAHSAEESEYLTDTPYYYGGAVANGDIPIGAGVLRFADGKCVSRYVSAQDIADIALAEVGTQATYCKRCKYNTWYYGTEVSGNGYEWCAVFVNWVFNEAGVYPLLGSTAANCGQMGLDFQQSGRLVTSDYAVGDVVFLHWSEESSYYLPGMKSLDHVGIIVGVGGDGSYTTVEGNTGPTSDGEVLLRTRYESQISCAGRPAYGFFTDTTQEGVASTSAPWDRLKPINGIPAGGEYRLRETVRGYKE